MKLQVDGKQVLELAEWQKSVIKNDMPEEIFQEDMERRVRWIIQEKFDRCWERFEKEWIERLRNDPSVKNIPLDRQEFTTLVLSRSDYKSRSEREREQI